MRRTTYLVVAAIAVIALAIAAFLVWPKLSNEKVTVRSGEIVLCTEGEVVSDTTESLQVSADEVKDYGVTTRVITCDLHAKLAALYDTAQKAIADGDLDAAKAALKDIVALDPLYRRASSQLTDIEAGRTPDTDSGGDDGGTSGGDPADPGDEPGTDNPAAPIVNLANFVPDTLTGFVGQGLIVDPLALTRDYLPTDQGDVAKLVIVVEQFQDADAAQAELDSVIKPAYPDGAADVDAGDAGYFGSNRSVAAVAFTDGSILVVLEIASTGDDASALEDTVIALAAEVAR